MKSIQHPQVAAKFASYPKAVQQKMLTLRKLILDTANELEAIKPLQETSKWGEPSYVTQSGSTIRIDWKPDSPEQYAIYFHCKTKLVETFKELYGDLFHYQGNRAIVFNLKDVIPVDEVTHCIELSLTYHQRKHLPLLGATPR